MKAQDDSKLDVAVDTFIKHENYNRNTKQHDIALIKLAKEVPIKNDLKMIRPACLWQSRQIDESGAIASGWGRTEYAGSTSDDLMKVYLDILDNQKCVKSFEDEDFLINENQICSGNLTGGHDTCQGGKQELFCVLNTFRRSILLDSGGPIQIATPDNPCASYIIGITSFGEAYCGGKNSPSVYTRVSAYLSWIEPKVWNVQREA